MSGRLRVASYEDRPEAMDSVILMGESLCRVDAGISLHLTIPQASAALRDWARKRPEIKLTVERPAGVSGWDVKAWLLLQELDSGREEALWLDSDMIVTRPISAVVREFEPGLLLVAEEWDSVQAKDVAHCWDVPPVRPVAPVNSCFVRATTAHRNLLQTWLAKTSDRAYRQAQMLPFEQRPWRLASDQALLTGLLGSPEFADLPFGSIRIGRHIAQCAGASGYRPGDRLKDLFRGLPPMIHCIGRKPWNETGFGSDLSAYVLAARKVASDLGMHPAWMDAHTTPGTLLRALSGGHPGMAGFPVALAHSLIANMRGRVQPPRK